MTPQIVLLFSGKRKSGKDFLTNHLKEILADRCEVIKISEPIKRHWANVNNLNLEELLSDGAYKEQYRIDMIKWSDEMRLVDYGYFCRDACQNASQNQIWIVSDIRRRSDICWFKETYGNLIRTIRIIADEATRRERGYTFKAGVDDVTSECDLDNYEEWNLLINNGVGRLTLQEQIDSIKNLMKNL